MISPNTGGVRASALDQYYQATMGPLGGGQGTVLGYDSTDTYTPSTPQQ